MYRGEVEKVYCVRITRSGQWAVANAHENFNRTEKV